MPATGLYSVGKLVQNLVGRSHAYWHDGNQDYRRIGTIGIVIASIAALSVCQWYMAVQYQCQMDCRRNGTIVQSMVCVVVQYQYQIDYRRNGTIVQFMVCVAVQCQYRVGSVGRLAQSLIIGLVRRHISIRSCQIYRHIGMRLISLYLYIYQHEILLGLQAYQYKTCWFVFAGISAQYLIIIIFLIKT